ncbi:MAG TPA: FHA domain-containing serine/threonine-protein kinase [Thermomicrobiales bacterium]
MVRTPTQDTLLGKMLGAYRIEALLGRGNRASVYQASDGGRRVAIRVFDRDLSAAPDFTERFQAQAAVLTTVRHPHLLANSEYAYDAGHAFIVRPYVAGRTLRSLLVAPLSAAEALRYLHPVAEALDFVHSRGLVHGDVKPGNILLPHDGPTMLVDLGVAQLFPRGNSLLMAATGRYYGTPEYLSPEQAHGLPLDGRTDSYALAVILYEALVGRPPFRAEGIADTPRTVAARHITAMPPKPRALNPDVSLLAESTLLRALDKDPERRFSSCVAVLDSLEEPRESWMIAPVASAVSNEDLPRTSFLDFAASASGAADIADSDPAMASRDADTDVASTEQLMAEHALKMQSLVETYEARFVTHAEMLRERNATVETLSAQLTEAHAQIARLTEQITEMEPLLRDREVLAERVRELEMAQARVPQRPVAARNGSSATPDAPRLVIVDPQSLGLPAGASFGLQPGALVGRHPDCAVCINDHFVSARHAQLTEEAGDWFVTDLGTTNGTYVNGKRINSPVLLTAGDLLRFGRVQAKFS